MPEIQLAGTRQSEQINATDRAAGISHAVVQDVSGRLYDVFISYEDNGRKRLHDRARAAWTLQQTKDLAALGFEYDTLVTFRPGTQSNSTGKSAQTDPAVLVCDHREGTSRDLNLLTTNDCMNLGTAIGSIHRLRPTFLTRANYPSFTTGQIRAQLTGWIKVLRKAGHIPTEITDSWSRVLETEGLWSFNTFPVHGGFQDGDVLFNGSTVSAITNWQGMQINDPARDLAWIFAKLNEQRRNAVLDSYGRMMGSRLDSMIMLRANLWLQMEQVGDFVKALQHGDNVGIMRFKAQVERLAHELTRIHGSRAQKAAEQANPNMKPSSTITVGTLLQNDERNAANAAKKANATQADDTTSSHAAADSTNENAIPNNANQEYHENFDNTEERTVTLNDDTHERPSTENNSAENTSAENTSDRSEADDTATQVITSLENADSKDLGSAKSAESTVDATKSSVNNAVDNAEDSEDDEYVYNDQDDAATEVYVQVEIKNDAKVIDNTAKNTSTETANPTESTESTESTLSTDSEKSTDNEDSKQESSEQEDSKSDNANDNLETVLIPEYETNTKNKESASSEETTEK